MRVILYPIGGLANRMRAIDAAYNFSVDRGSKLMVYWIKDNGLNCDYYSLFCPNPNIRDSNGHVLKFFFYLHRRFQIIQPLFRLFEKLNFIKVFIEKDTALLSKFVTQKNLRFCYVIIKSYSHFSFGDKFHPELFTLAPDVEKKVKSETDKFTENTIGVHIRRSDNLYSVTNSPLELFEDKMTRLITDCPDTNFYITSDDTVTKRYFEQSNIWKDRTILPQGIISRNSADGIIQAVIEMFALSETKLIIGSYWSSFSEMASIVGNKKLYIVQKVY